DDSDDGLWRNHREPDGFSYRVLAGQEFARIGLVHQRDRKPALRIALVDITARKDGRTVCGKPSRRDLIGHDAPRVPERHRTRFRLRGWRAGYVYEAQHASTGDGSGHRP